MAGISTFLRGMSYNQIALGFGHVGKGGRQCNAESQTEIEITVEIGIWPYSLIAERCLFKVCRCNRLGTILCNEVRTMYEDKTLVCKECGNEFVFTAGEQEFYAEKGFANEPQRCKACRDARKAATKSERQTYTATCASCGGEAIPFKPREDRLVYCSECFAKMKRSRANFLHN